ncbi:hypothetical protein O3M35_002857 [Rhynocoris fuscipes]|uniref:Regulatory protein zeste n=1 Tax=Rhynocoris fuscipes TaxID=488301 RepID=A0AAW1CUK1_9HEMI
MEKEETPLKRIKEEEKNSLLMEVVKKEKTCHKHFTEEEKSSLLEIINKKKNIIELKKTDVISQAQKKVAWEEVAVEFNSFPNHRMRTVSQLKKLWENLKFRKKAELSAEKRDRMWSGGGNCSTYSPQESLVHYVEVDIPEISDADPLALPNDRHDEGNYDTDENSMMSSGRLRRGKKLYEEMEFRREKDMQLIKNEAELHQLKMEEQRLKVELMKKKIEHEDQLFQLKKRKLENELNY